jgi:putative flavoprotein involved in K+ transport
MRRESFPSYRRCEFERREEREMSATQVDRYETVIVGGGQAGLATGYHLTKRGRSCVILDAGERVGDSWRKRWPSLKLYSPASVDGLPGMRFPAPGFSFPSGYEMADYLEAYAARFELPVRSGVLVDGLDREGERYVVTAGERRFEAENVVVATGVMQKPVTPDFASELDPRIRQLHSLDYRSPDQLQPGAVLVVGAAHSGGDIAYEVARAGYRTILSGRHTGQIPLNIEGLSGRLAFPVMKVLATRVLTVNTPIGRKMRPQIRSHGGPLLRVKKADLEGAGVERELGRTVGVEGGRPVLEDGRVLDVANVVWCTGFRNDFDWIRVPVDLDADGYPEQWRGAVASAPGLYFVGMLFLHSFSSMLILGAGRDSERVVKHIASRRPSEARTVAEAPTLAEDGVAA